VSNIACGGTLSTSFFSCLLIVLLAVVVAYLFYWVRVCFFRDLSEDIKESQNIASLHKQIAACDVVLEVDITSLFMLWQSLTELLDWLIF